MEIGNHCERDLAPKPPILGALRVTENLEQPRTAGFAVLEQVDL